MSWLLLFWLFLKASLFSTGGMGNLPSLHADLVPRGWATDAYFEESLTVGQIAPGPNGLWTLSLGYFVAGVPGALISLVAITLPPVLVLAVARLYRQVKDHPVVEGLVRGLGLAVVGVSVVVLWGLLQHVGADWRTLGIAAASIGLAATRRVPVALILALGGFMGVAVR